MSEMTDIWPSSGDQFYSADTNIIRDFNLKMKEKGDVR